MFRWARLLVLCLAAGSWLVLLGPLGVHAAGWVEARAGGVRPKLSADQIRAFVPASRGAFTFPPPYGSEAVRITDASDCPGGTDCVSSMGYAYWRNTNNHVGSDEMLIFLSLDRRKGGSGPTLFRYNKETHRVAKIGPLFNPTSKFTWDSAQGWYFSASLPSKLYLNDGPRLLRYDVVTGQFETVFDASGVWGNDKYIVNAHSSNDDAVHSASLKIQGTDEALGCLVYHERSRRFAFFGKLGEFEECALDKSGHWLLSQENIDGRYGADMRIFDLGTEREIGRVFHEEGGATRADLGYGYIVGDDAWNASPNATVTWVLGQQISRGPVVHANINWSLDAMHDRTHTNAKAGVPMEDQFACGSTADRGLGVENEITCVRLDGSDRQLIVAPTMSRLDAHGGQREFDKYPKGNLDITGEYFLWTTNLSGDRLDAFLVKVPSGSLY